jgi:hypothetical protein
MYSLPADAYRDKNMMEWIMAPKSGENDTSLDLFNSLMQERFEKRAALGGIGPIAAYNVKTTSFAQINAEKEIINQIENNDVVTQDILRELVNEHGAQALQNLSPKELYSLYKDHTDAVRA